MTIEDLDKIDRSYRDPDTGHAVLVITDHLPWDVDEGRHLELLQAKVYRQLDAIESGEVAAKIPFARGRSFAIAIYSLFELSQDGRNLVNKLTHCLAGMGIELRWIHFDPNATPIKPDHPN
ncbi:MAG: DUF6572 domain-containing protein [Roseiarcus sp.]|jgi:phosphatidylserine/phosphatidylglycerophosphate/cardiolipin synthase-like enzyme